MLEELFAGGFAAVVVLVLMLVEAGVLLALSRTGRGLPAVQVVTGLGAGICLVLALRAALVDAPWPAVAMPLILGGLLHATDLMLRFRRAADAPIARPVVMRMDTARSQESRKVRPDCNGQGVESSLSSN